MLTLDEIRQKLEDRNLKAVSEKSGVDYQAIIRLMKPNSRPDYETVRKLMEYLEA